ncbi:MAG: amino acid synthesis family protein [Betaproteobacteria bacterium]|nr:amino acid synthesis family protein [Betaproteobacteria bacterium]
MQARKILITRESIYSDAGRDTARAITRVIGLAVIANPCAGRFVADLASLFDAGADIAERLMPEMMALLPNQPIAYGKAAIVGVNGEIEHAAAILHPRMGKPMRAAVGGGEAIIPSTSKVAPAGSMIDVPLGHKDNVWSFDEIDTITVGVADAPRPDEIVVIIAVSDGGRPHPRVGKGRVA